MLNITQALRDSVSIAFQKAFARHHDIQILFQNLKYSTTCPATFSEYYKSNYQKEWKETLLPKDVAHEILVHFQSPTWNQFKLVSNIEVTQLGHLQFQINKQYYEHLIKQIETAPWPNLTPIYKTTNIYGPFIDLNGSLNKTDLRGLHIQNRLYCILSKLSENCNKFNNITNQISKNDYLILPAKFANPFNPFHWGYNQVLNESLHFDCKDPITPLYGIDDVEPLIPSVELLAHFPQVLVECLETKSFKQLYQFELTYPKYLLK